MKKPWIWFLFLMVAGCSTAPKSNCDCDNRPLTQACSMVCDAGQGHHHPHCVHHKD